ncbi:hypothetical protein CfE428DRAFT_1042 [Chthoniobacter flavus Ellin428]|uniref:Uncharacterized protein n=1 Tax=Chthoniobacter flavus Ellin428 TaxID=497964 RepID=B4CWK4_9BACT|nr:hypothetical protein [Chthoniobacter flavus]EDY21796.1 hypothetical protein CfE428DRAFT_1042 [Chthoniobacter flavus Ellin428]TCO95725.1 hypothetical protein EV701_101416 [Chthoniobacter flavus]
MTSRFLLHSNFHSSFSLTREGRNWRRQFNDLKAALDYAAGMTSTEAPLVVYNEYGRVIIESFIKPNVVWRD